MPNATPLPRGPSRLTLYGAGDLLNSAGCPVCGYIAEAAGRFYAWFALEAYAEPGTITRLCESLGLCPRHTRGLLGQPGADGRLTVVYRHVLHTAKAYLAAGRSPRAPCPACARETAAADRAIDTLLAGMREQEIRHRYREHGGLCLPHLRTAAARSARRQAAWLAHTALARITTAPPAPAALAGEADADADVRAASCGPPSGRPGLCAICLAAAHAERDSLAQVIGEGQERPALRPGLCPAHLRDALAGMASHSRAASAGAARLLARQAEGPMAWLSGLASQPAGRPAVRPLTWRRRNPHNPIQAGTCPACEAWEAAALFETERLRWVLGASHVAPSHMPGLCLRHVMSLREPGQQAGDFAVRAAIRGTGLLVAELDEAFRKRTWAHRHETRGAEMTAWQRAAAFIDGRVYGGGPPARL
ncbi:MAG: hypothetical protein ACM3ML_23200 [Micromonosporaceae bacterium]